MRIAIIGSGAIGCLYGAYLSRKNEVYMICRRKEAADAIRRDGLTVHEPDGSAVRYAEAKAILTGECPGSFDLTVIIVKSFDTENAISANLDLVRNSRMLMTLQNGGGNDAVLARYVPMERVIIGTTRHNSVNLGNGNIRHSGSGTTFIGSNVEDADLSEVAAAFEEAGFETVVSDDIQRIVWSKLFVNLSINSFTAITGTPIGAMVESEYAWSYAETLVREAIDVAAAEGIRFSAGEVLESIRKTCLEVASGYSSMSQDVMNCRKTEVDRINGFVVERAKVHNIPAPYNAFVQNLIHVIESTYPYRKQKPAD